MVELNPSLSPREFNGVWPLLDLGLQVEVIKDAFKDRHITLDRYVRREELRDGPE